MIRPLIGGGLTSARATHQSGHGEIACDWLIDNGTLRTTLGEHYGTINAENLRRAHAFIESGKARGKIVLEGF